MKKFKTLKIIAVSLVLGLVINLALPAFLHDSTEALGGLDVVWGVPDGDPIFVVENMLPGDQEVRNVTVNSGASVSRLISVKGARTGGVGDDPKLESVLEIVISEAGSDLYGGSAGTKTVQDFFDESQSPDGIQLSVLGSGSATSYDFKVTFLQSAGNELHVKSVIFDITIGFVVSENIVINEVYYRVDEDHGLDSPRDRGIESVNGNNVSVIIANNGAGSTNTVNVNIKEVCKIIQTNNANFTNNVNINRNTGGNSANNNSGGSTSIITGASNALVNISNSANVNIGSCGKKLGQNNEWIELFNPTDHEISLKKWTIADNSGISRTIPGNRKLGPGEFALLSKDNATWTFWSEDPDALKIPLGNQIGDGLDNDGDRLILKNAAGETVDQLSYHDDTSIFDPSIPSVSLGASFERLAPGYDTDLVSDFIEQAPPTPGN